MILLLVFVVIVISVILYVMFRTPEIPVDHPDNKPQIPFDAEKKYVESLRILNQMSENTQRTSKPKVSITLNNVKLLTDNNSNTFKINNSKELVSKLTVLGDVYIFYKTEKDFTQQQTILNMFQGLIPAHKIMHCTTEEGLIGMIRQLKPRFHIENNIFVIERLAPHLNQIISMTSTQTELRELSVSDVRRINILNHNIDFFNSIEEIFNYVAQIMKSR